MNDLDNYLEKLVIPKHIKEIYTKIQLTPEYSYTLYHDLMFYLHNYIDELEIEYMDRNKKYYVINYLMEKLGNKDLLEREEENLCLRYQKCQKDTTPTL